MTYRRDIDGLRAVAVLAVVAFHAFPSLVRGGFVGVDLFFVISGFLITGIIRDGMDRGTFSVRHFYARRIRRIFPALAVVLAATLALGYLLLLPDEYRRLGSYTLAGAFFLSNFAIWRESGYFAPAAAQNSLLLAGCLGLRTLDYRSLRISRCEVLATANSI